MGQIPVPMRIKDRIVSRERIEIEGTPTDDVRHCIGQIA